MTTPRRRVAFAPQATPSITARISRGLTRRSELEGLRLACIARDEQRKQAKVERVRAIRDVEGPSTHLFGFARLIGVSTGHLHALGVYGHGDRR